MLIVLLLSLQNCFSQTNDSLHHLIKTSSRQDTTYVLALAELASQFNGAQPDSSFLYATEGDSLSKRMGYPKGRGRALRVLGIYYYLRGNYVKSLEYLEAGLNFSQKADDKNNLARCYGNIGAVVSEQGNNAKALEYLTLSLKMREQIGDRRGIVIASNSIGIIYEESGNNAKALEYFTSSLKLANEINDKRSIAAVHQNIGAIYTNEKKYVEALKHYQSALKNLGSIGNEQLLIFVYGNLAETYIDLKETTKALPYLYKAFDEAKKLEIPHGTAFVEGLYAKYYNAINDFNSAYRYASESQALAKKIGHLETWRDASKQKYLSANGLGKYKEALENYELFVRLNDSLKSEQVKKKTASMEFQLKQEKAKREQETKELQFAIEQERRKLITASVAGLVFISALIASYFLYKLWSGRTKREMAKIRERISRDIHDDMGSNLSTINILSGVALETLSTSESIKAKEVLGKISIMSNIVMESVDEIVWSINPRHDSFQKIVARMRAIGCQLENQGIAFSFNVKGDPSKCTLDLEQRHDFYLIYKEAITNIAKYAKCQNVVATIVIAPTQVSMSVKDDGVGFKVDFQSDGNGLRNMSSRAKNLNGELKIVSADNQGTALELAFPV